MSLSDDLTAAAAVAKDLEGRLQASVLREGELAAKQVIASGELIAARAEVSTLTTARDEAVRALADHMAAEHPPEPDPEPVPDPLQVQNVRHASQTATGFVAAWDAVEGAEAYDVWRDVNEDGTGGWRWSRKTAPQTTQGFPNLAPGTSIRVMVLAIVGGAAQAESTPVVLSTLPAAPVDPAPEEQSPAGSRKATLHPFLSSAFSNTAIGSGAIYSDEPAFRIGGADVNAERWTFPIYVAKYTDQTFTITDDNNRSFTLRIPESAVASAGTDAHLNIFQPDGRTSYEMWGAVRTSAGWDARYVVKTDALGTGMGAGARASGISHLHGVIRAEELLAGEINHTLCISLDNDQLKMGPVWPAQNEDGNAKDTYHGGIPLGAMFAIEPGAPVENLPGVQTKTGRALVRTLKTRGGHALLRAANTNLFCEMSVPARAPQELADLRKAWPVLRPWMKRITNNTAANVAGGGTRLAPPLPEVVAG